MIEVRCVPGKGRGIIAAQPITKNTLIEIAPVGSFPSEQRSVVDQTEVFEYYFVIPSDYHRSKSVSGHIVFGLTSLCNHVKEPNARVEWITDEVGLWAHLVSVRDIAKGEEVSVFYTNIDEYVLADQFV